MTWEHVFLTFLALWSLYLGSVTIGLVRRLSTQLATLTLRLTDLIEAIEYHGQDGA